MVPIRHFAFHLICIQFIHLKHIIISHSKQSWFSNSLYSFFVSIAFSRHGENVSAEFKLRWCSSKNYHRSFCWLFTFSHTVQFQLSLGFQILLHSSVLADFPEREWKINSIFSATSLILVKCWIFSARQWIRSPYMTFENILMTWQWLSPESPVLRQRYTPF